MGNHCIIMFYHILLDPYWTYFWKHYMYYKKATKFGSQNFGYQIWFCTRLVMESRMFSIKPLPEPPIEPIIKTFKWILDQNLYKMILITCIWECQQNVVHYVQAQWVNWLFPGSIICEIALGWMSKDLTDDKSTLVQVMVWCHQAPSHYLSQCWPRFYLMSIWHHYATMS